MNKKEADFEYRLQCNKIAADHGILTSDWKLHIDTYLTNLSDNMIEHILLYPHEFELSFVTAAKSEFNKRVENILFNM